MRVPTEINEGDSLLGFTIEQPNYFKTDKGIYLTPEFVMAYNALAMYENAHNPEGGWSDIVDDDEDVVIYSTQIDGLRYSTDYYPLGGVTPESIPDQFRKTRLLEKMMTLFPTDYLYVNVKLQSRSVSVPPRQGYFQPSFLKDVFDSLFIDELKNTTFNFRSRIEMLETGKGFHFNPELGFRVTPSEFHEKGFATNPLYRKQEELNKIEAVEYSSVRTHFSPFSIVQFLPLTDAHTMKAASEEDYAISSDELIHIMTRMRNVFFSKINDLAPRPEVKEAIMKRLDPSARQTIATALNTGARFSSLLATQLDHLSHAYSDREIRKLPSHAFWNHIRLTHNESINIENQHVNSLHVERSIGRFSESDSFDVIVESFMSTIDELDKSDEYKGYVYSELLSLPLFVYHDEVRETLPDIAQVV